MALNINGTTGISGVNGSASAPALQGTDSNTGVSFGTDTVNINTGGTTRATVDSSGRLKVNSPAGSQTHTLQVESDGNANAIAIMGRSADDIGELSWLENDGSTRLGEIQYRQDHVNFRHRVGDMRFSTTSSGTMAERMRLDSDGKLLVGRTSSITISGDGTSHVFEAITDNGYALATHSNTSNKRGIGIYYPSGGTAGDAIRFVIGSSAKFIVLGSGNVQNANNSYGSISDISLKENIVDANSQWDDIKNIKIRNYNFKESTGQQTHTQIGVVAQELETVSPKLVETNDKDGLKTVQYSVLYMKAVKALQEAIAKIETLETEKAKMQTDLTALTARVTALEAA